VLTFIAVTTLALGTGASTASSRWSTGLMFKPAPFAAPEELLKMPLKAADRFRCSEVNSRA
jgi:hypothetical protein